MARPRKDLHAKLQQVLIDCGVDKSHCYFQPPSTLQMQYPCIRYARAKYDTWDADNYNYIMAIRYDVTVIDEDPDSEIPKTLLGSFKEIFHSRAYTADNLNHDAFTLYW